ncbi:glutathione S-transferase N-terminal domain-containing protein [Caulobacter sp. KR2-114]|uniref:glutathione S-transferase N-terminal domain-containing protein n=1 Tax=Caulobacter sp. KR2-114 TaxID=3400912 RepID=UPI003BFFDBE3
MAHTDTGAGAQPIILYAMPGSLYSAKARAYLRKQRLAVEERVPGDPRFEAVVQAVGRWIIPVAQMPDGAMVQDSSAIIDAVEAAGLARLSAYPADPVARVLALIFELFGGEGMVRPAMHYRWNFDADNLAFIGRDFVNGLKPGAGPEEAEAVFAASSGRMRRAAEAFGVTPQTFAAVEASYLKLLDLLNAHFATRPYLLGATPSLGDYGLIAPLHAHLSRDPHPAAIMKTRALHVWRWVERMTSPDIDAGEFCGRTEYGEPASDTLKALLAFVAEDYLPELQAMTAWIDAWLDTQDPAVLGAAPIRRAIGRMTFTWRGQDITVGVFPYRLYLLQRVQDAADALSPAEHGALSALLSGAGLTPLLRLRTRRRVERRDNAEWWAPV